MVLIEDDNESAFNIFGNIVALLAGHYMLKMKNIYGHCVQILVEEP